jgi:hypothetical protein
LPVEGCILICGRYILRSTVHFGVPFAVAFLSSRRAGIEEALDDADIARAAQHRVGVHLVVAYATDAVYWSKRNWGS